MRTRITPNTETFFAVDSITSLLKIRIGLNLNFILLVDFSLMLAVSRKQAVFWMLAVSRKQAVFWNSLAVSRKQAVFWMLAVPRKQAVF